MAPNDPRQYSNQFLEAKLRELERLCKNGTWEEVWKDDVPSTANKMRGRFVRTIKDINTANKIIKARFVAQGYKDQDKNTIVQSAVLARQSSTRTVVSLAAAHGWDIQTHDVTKAYVQDELLQREIYLITPKELQLAPNRMLRLLKHLYGLTDSGNIWFESLMTVLRDHLRMPPLTGIQGSCFVQIMMRFNGLLLCMSMACVVLT
jgi:hypothetical protein